MPLMMTLGSTKAVQPQRCAVPHRPTVLQVSCRNKQSVQPSSARSSEQSTIPRERRRRLLISLLVAANTAVWIKLSSAQHNSVVSATHHLHV